MGVTLRKRKNADGTTSLILDIYHNGKRSYEFLKDLKLKTKPSSPIDRQTNKENLELAESIRNKRAQELVSSGYDVVTSFKSNVDFIQYFENYISKYTKKDKRNMEGACNRFKAFMKKEGIKSLTMKQLNENIVFKYSEYLRETSQGEGASSYFKRFKKMIKQAVREKVLLNNPTSDVTIKRDDSLVKQVLTIDEIKILAETPITNGEVRNAFLFCCFTGLSWIDVKELKWKHIDLRNQKLTKVRAKTGTETVVNLHSTPLSMLTEPGQQEDLVFTLPSNTAALKSLRSWVSKAEIQKHITWHCARHSFATNLVHYKTDVTIISKLLGHSTLKYTQRYTHIAEDLKREAVNKLPTI
ncbi:site-specific integrase [Taibaiella soli]|uniref:Site-specific integrase n=1 Tax=Taibaiella soli TaxID=1649169 RepID=A0A2W2BBI4_9BACT|nr:site-specific integrase [Taibaiella soli]PZF73559.1 site-specific integrase [Taibaiella soli]